MLKSFPDEKGISCPVNNRSTYALNRKLKKIPAHLKEVKSKLWRRRCCMMSSNLCWLQVAANTINSTMSGYLQRTKPMKKQGKKKWFVIKENILYTYAASEVNSWRL